MPAARPRLGACVAWPVNFIGIGLNYTDHAAEIGMDLPNGAKVTAGLIERRVFVDYRPDCGIRVSPHFYTAEEEIDEFFRVLDEVRRYA